MRPRHALVYGTIGEELPYQGVLPSSRASENRVLECLAIPRDTESITVWHHQAKGIRRFITGIQVESPTLTQTIGSCLGEGFGFEMTSSDFLTQVKVACMKNGAIHSIDVSIISIDKVQLEC